MARDRKKQDEVTRAADFTQAGKEQQNFTKSYAQNAIQKGQEKQQQAEAQKQEQKVTSVNKDNTQELKTELEKEKVIGRDLSVQNAMSSDVSLEQARDLSVQQELSERTAEELQQGLEQTQTQDLSPTQEWGNERGPVPTGQPFFEHVWEEGSDKSVFALALSDVGKAITEDLNEKAALKAAEKVAEYALER